MRFRGLLLMAVILGMACFAQADDSLRLSVAYPDPTFAKITCVFQNRLDKPVKITSPETTMGFAQAVQITTPDGDVVQPTSRTVRMEQNVTLTVPAHDVLRVTVPVTQDFTLERGKLYFLAMDFATDIPGQRFSGEFPFGLPGNGAKLQNSRPDNPKLSVSMEFAAPLSTKVTLILTNNSANPIAVVPSQYLGPEAVEMRDAKGMDFPIDVLTPGAPANAAITIKPGAVLRMPMDVQGCSGTAIEPGKLYFALIHYPVANSKACFTGIFPVGLPLAKTAGSSGPCLTY